MLSALDDEDTISVKDDEIAYMVVMLTQMSLKAGLKAFGDQGKGSALKEMTQLHDMDTFFPRDPK